jgi:hypothetical protein
VRIFIAVCAKSNEPASAHEHTPLTYRGDTIRCLVVSVVFRIVCIPPNPNFAMSHSQKSHPKLTVAQLFEKLKPMDPYANGDKRLGLGLHGWRVGGIDEASPLHSTIPPHTLTGSGLPTQIDIHLCCSSLMQSVLV